MARSISLLALGGTLLIAPSAWAAGQATPDEAKVMATKAAEYLKSVGPDKAFPEFNAKDGPWHDRDVYVTVLDSKGRNGRAWHESGPLRKSMIDLKDVDGKAFNGEILAVTDTGWVNFKWQNPLTKAVEAKTAYEVRVGDYVIGVGAYAK
jgi:cytochrome c